MQKLTLSILKDFTNDIILLGENVTKTNLKGLARANQYVVDSSFKDLFNWSLKFLISKKHSSGF